MSKYCCYSTVAHLCTSSCICQNSLCGKIIKNALKRNWLEKLCFFENISKFIYIIIFQMCEPAKKLKRCKYFRDVTWSYVTYPDQQNSTQQIMHCRCPKNSVAYLIKRHAFQTPKGTGYQYSFACSPQTVRYMK